MCPRKLCFWALGLLFLGQPTLAQAGMPAPLPTNPERILRLNDTALVRLQTISFFLLGFLISAAVVRWLWNYLRRDFPRLPHLTFGKALAGVLLWGLLFVIVLTMVSGARELMTPGAWQKQGFTYKLNPRPGTEVELSPAVLREQHLERLRTALWQFAATHNGHFPSAGEMDAISADLWTIPEFGGLRYQYLPGRSATPPAALLVYEPEIDSERWVLQTNGDIAKMHSEEIRALEKGEKQP